MTFPDDDLLVPAQPLRGITPDELAGLAYSDSSFGMSSTAGDLRVSLLCMQVEEVLDSGLDRDTAILTLIGGMLRLHADGYPEATDTVVRESIRMHLEDAFGHSGLEPVTDAEIYEAACILSDHHMRALRSGFLQGMASGQAVAAGAGEPTE